MRASRAHSTAVELFSRRDGWQVSEPFTTLAIRTRSGKVASPHPAATLPEPPAELDPELDDPDPLLVPEPLEPLPDELVPEPLVSAELEDDPDELEPSVVPDCAESLVEELDEVVEPEESEVLLVPSDEVFAVSVVWFVLDWLSVLVPDSELLAEVDS